MEGTAKDLAMMLGVTVQRIYQLTSDDILKKIKRNQYNIPDNIQRYIEYQKGLERSKFKSDDMDVNQARTIQEIEKAKKLIRERQIDEGLYIEKDKVVEIGNKIIYAAKSRLLSIPTAAARRLLKKNSQREIKKILEFEINKGLDELSRISNI